MRFSIGGPDARVNFVSTSKPGDSTMNEPASLGTLGSATGRTIAPQTRPTGTAHDGSRTAQLTAAGISARLDRIPASRPVWAMVFMLALGAWFEIYDMFLTAYVSPGLVKSRIFTNTTASVFDLTGLGAFVCTLFLGPFIRTFCVTVADGKYC